MVAVARQSTATVSQVAADFGISESSLQRSRAIDDRRSAGGDATTDTDIKELREVMVEHTLKARSTAS